MRGGAGAADGSSMVTVPASASVNFLTTEDSMSDDVFEMDDDRFSTVTNIVSGGLTPATVERPFEKTPSPTGYRDYKPPAEVLSNNYSTTFKTTSDFDSVRSALKREQQRDDNFAHKTILLGDSGVGKTSLLVQFDTGKFQPGNFAATVGIGFTVHRIEVTASTNHCEPSLNHNNEEKRKNIDAEILMKHISFMCKEFKTFE